MNYYAKKALEVFEDTVERPENIEKETGERIEIRLPKNCSTDDLIAFWNSLDSCR
jgi:hypothetical protein